MFSLLKNRDRGITLLEVLLSLVITGIIVNMVLSLYLDQYRLLTEVRQKAELRFAVFKANQVLTSAITKSEEISWINGHTLLTRYLQGEYLITDYYYLDDKDGDGTQDLYRRHLGISNPIVTGLTEMSVQEVVKALWQIDLKASFGSQECESTKKVRQRICQ